MDRISFNHVCSYLTVYNFFCANQSDFISRDSAVNQLKTYLMTKDATFECLGQDSILLKITKAFEEGMAQRANIHWFSGYQTNII